MIYNVAKAIGASATVLCGKIDAILLTGGIAYSDYVISRLKKESLSWLPIYVYPGENEMESLAFNAIGALKGNCRYKSINRRAHKKAIQLPITKQF